jgi:acyl homoserine lactone synthase
MEIITLSFEDSHLFGDALNQFYKLRKKHFVDKLEWSLCHNERIEMDQYDNPNAHYILGIHNGVVIGGARLLSTQGSWGNTSYMLKDAMLGRISSIPSKVFNTCIENQHVWEGSRLVISDDVISHSRRSAVLYSIIRGIVQFLQDKNGKRLLTFSPVTLKRRVCAMGFPVKQVGLPIRGFGDNRTYAVLSLELEEILFLDSDAKRAA